MKNKQNQKSHTQCEWDALSKKETAFLQRRQSKKDTALNKLLAEKIPEKLQYTLNIAFEKAFTLIFEKGTWVIEKTYKKDDLEKEFMVNVYANEVYSNRKSLKVFSKNAAKAGNLNLVLSGVSGIGMGILGVGLPDIPVFTGMVLKCIYEIALSYGFDYSSDTERYFVLLLVEGAVSYGEHLKLVNKKIDSYILTHSLPENYSRQEQLSNTCNMLSKELLYMKFLQGIPIVGAAGGAYDIIYMKNISAFSKIKYHKRFLSGLIKSSDPSGL